MLACVTHDFAWSYRDDVTQVAVVVLRAYIGIAPAVVGVEENQVGGSETRRLECVPRY